jgi:hypothetical protein
MQSRAAKFAVIGPLFMLAALASAQTSFPPIDESHAPPALVRSVAMVPDPDGPAIEIVTTRPISPEITLVENPERLVVDLSKSILPAAKVIAFHNEAITGVRVNQFQKSPPITRIVVDLKKPIGYSWDAAGNRLMIRLRSSPIQVPALNAPTVPTAVVPVRSSPGTVVTSSPGPGGSTISAGAERAILRLTRGGEVDICPGTAVSVTYSQSGRDLMLGMSTGTLETDYSLGTAADSILTPDFRILMSGPGDFHYAISADSRGNTCVRSLPGNTAPVTISELMGDKSYQVKPAEQAYFHAGRVANVTNTIPADCGCPSTGVPVLRATTPPAATPGGSRLGSPQVAVADPGIGDLPPPQKNQVHVAVDVPFVFRASDVAGTPPAPAAEGSGLAMTYALPPESLELTVLPPPPPAPKGRGFFGKVKGFFSGIFR